MARFLVAATLARGADGGAAVALVLLAVQSAVSHGAAVGGLLAAGLLTPHALGPWVARALDRARDGRRFLAGAFVGYGVALAAAGVAFGHVPVPVVLACTVVAGACGPLLTGGLSSRVAGLCGPDPRAQRRGEGWDAVSYGLAGTLGPAAVAGLAALTDVLTAVLTLAAAAVVAAVITLTLPADPSRADRPVAAVRAVLALLVRHGPLRRVNLATLSAAFCLGALPVLAVVLAGHLSTDPDAGATLVAVFGAGTLVGSLVLTAFPLRGEAETLSVRYVAVLGVAALLTAAAPVHALALAGFAAIGLANAPFVTATFAARSQYAPPEARAQVFVTMSSLKVAAAATGTAAAGVLTALGPRLLPAVFAAVVLLGSAAAMVDRRLSPRHP
jgi:predicted MFS family arabinose efflux permease